MMLQTSSSVNVALAAAQDAAVGYVIAAALLLTAEGRARAGAIRLGAAEG
jgi:hypothetical protein